MSFKKMQVTCPDCEGQAFSKVVARKGKYPVIRFKCMRCQKIWRVNHHWQLVAPTDLDKNEPWEAQYD